METLTSVHDRLILKAVHYLHRAEDNLLARLPRQRNETLAEKPVRFWLLLGGGLSLLVAATSAAFMPAERVERRPLMVLTTGISVLLLCFALAQWKRWRAEQAHAPRQTMRAAAIAISIVMAGCSFALAGKAVVHRARQQRIEAVIQRGKQVAIRNAEVRRQIANLSTSPRSFDQFYIDTRALQSILDVADNQIAEDAALVDGLRREYFDQADVISFLFLVDKVQQEDSAIAAALRREINCADGLYHASNTADQKVFRELCIAPNAADAERASNRKLLLVQTIRERGESLPDSDPDTTIIGKLGAELNVL